MRRFLLALVVLAMLAGMVALFILMNLPDPRPAVPVMDAPPQDIPAPPQAQQQVHQQQGTLKGKVIHGENNQPVPGATIIVLAPHLDSGEDGDVPVWGDMIEKARITTGPDGSFELKELPPDYWNIWAEKKGYGFTSVPRAQFDHEHVIKLYPGATIRGRVIYDDETPAAGVRVEYTPQGLASEVFSRYRLKSYYTQTRTDGTFEYNELPPGKFTVEIYPPDHLPAPWTTELPLKPGEFRDLGIRKLDGGFGMTVYVKWRGTNEPVSGVEVACRPVGDPMPRTKIGQRRITDKNGRAVFRGLGGQSLPKPGFTVAANIGGGPVVPDKPGFVAPGETVTIYVRRQATLVGRVVRGNGEPLPRFFISLKPKGFIHSQLQQWFTSEKNGEFLMSGVPEGTHTMTVRFPGLIPTDVEVTAIGAQETDVGTIVLEEGAEIWGSVSRDSGRELHEVTRVVLSRKVIDANTDRERWEPISRCVVLKDGTYRLRGLPLGTFWLQPLEQVNLSTTEPEEVTISGRSDSLQRNLVLHGSGFVDFSFWDEVEGSRRLVVPVPTFLVRKADGKEYRWWGNGVRLRPGTYEVQFQMPDAAGVSKRHTWKTIRVQEDETTGPIEVSLPEIRNGQPKEDDDTQDADQGGGKEDD